MKVSLQATVVASCNFQLAISIFYLLDFCDYVSFLKQIVCVINNTIISKFNGTRINLYNLTIKILTLLTSQTINIDSVTKGLIANKKDHLKKQTNRREQ